MKTSRVAVRSRIIIIMSKLRLSWPEGVISSSEMLEELCCALTGCYKPRLVHTAAWSRLSRFKSSRCLT